MVRIDGLTSAAALQDVARPAPTAGAPKAGFADTLTSAIEKVDDLQATAQVDLHSVATGENVDLHGTMIHLQQANIALRTMGSVRDQLVQGWETIWGLQI